MKAECPACGNERAREYTVTQRFPYGVAPDTVELSVMVPVVGCPACGLETTDRRAEALRETAVQKYLEAQGLA